ncbi:GH16548 [Drosophila grimshawi]|uniref:RNA helicase n=1 Tax=Drosophila grimshawi TaxID=7222 RepID=B4J1L4_DROGR|nr:GH16548 [Drosophila grimshawi]
MEGAIAHDLANGEQRTSDVAAGSVSFEELQLKHSILKCLQLHKFVTPTKIQAAAIPMALAGMDLLVQSKSGTGKTLIYVLAAMELMDRSVAKPQALIIVPTRELAIQVEDTVNGLASKMRNTSEYLCVSFIGGTDVKRDRLRMAKGRILVGTPGRLLHLMHNNVFNISGLKLLVLDEADQLFATDTLQKDVQSLISSLQSRKQIIACSATYPNALDERLAQLMHKPVLVSNSERATVLLGIRQFVYELQEQPNSMLEMLDKLTALHKIFAQLPYEQGILFASSQSRADSFRNYLRRDGIECDLMSGAMKQSERLETFQAYRNFKMRTMVATDLLARGVDFSHANLVINLDPPNDLVTYLHRIGRAGRFGSKGIAITFISSPQQCQHFRRIISEAGTGMSVLRFPLEKRDAFNFWNYDDYDFPYFQKTLAREQEENELKRIKQRWKAQGTDEQLQHTVSIINEHKPAQHLDINVNLVEQELKQNDELEVVQPKAFDEIQFVSQIGSVPENTLKDAKHGFKPQLALDVVLNVDNIIETQNESLLATEQITVNNKDSYNEHLSPKQISNKSKNALDFKTKKLDGPQALHEISIELKDLTLSNEIPAAAPNSINTKTYCLVAPPTEGSSTTLHPLAISNTVDDASSIISDSMENDYDSDASYSSCYSESDAQLIWHCALSHRKLQKRHNSRRHMCIFHWRHCSLIRATTQKPRKNLIRATNEKQPKSLIRSISKKTEFLRLLKKFNNVPQIQERLKAHFKQSNFDMQQYDQWIDLLYDAMQRLYYGDHSKPKKLPKLAVPRISNLGKKLIQFIKGPTSSDQHDDDDGNEEPQQPLNKLSVHVIQQMNILPANAANNNAEDAYSINSESSFDSDSMDANSLELEYSSSGFVESDESASSGIDESQYDSNSSRAFDSDDFYEEEEDEEDNDDDDDEDEDGENIERQSIESETDTSSISTLSAEKIDDSDETESESETEVQAIDENGVYDARAELALAQTRWQYLFHMQYQFIANYVDNYMATYRRHH